MGRAYSEDSEDVGRAQGVRLSRAGPVSLSYRAEAGPPFAGSTRRAPRADAPLTCGPFDAPPPMFLDLIRSLNPAFYGPDRFRRSVPRALFHLTIVIMLGESWRLRCFYKANEKDFAQLSVPNMLQQSLDGLPDDLQFELKRSNPQEGVLYPELTLNRAT
eukprot:7390805-Prymnesium_polylepis.2